MLTVMTDLEHMCMNYIYQGKFFAVVTFYTIEPWTAIVLGNIDLDPAMQYQLAKRQRSCN